MDPNSIKSVSVVKRATNTIEKYEDLFKKYEERAANGIISIRTEEVKKSVEEENSGWGMDFKTSSAKDNIVLLKENKDVDYKKALITLNGEEITFAEMDKINTKDIENVSVFKGKYNPDFVAMYGEKVKNGIIMIETRGYVNPSSNVKIKEKKSDFSIDAENGSFTIHKRSRKSDFEFYEKQLYKIGVNIKISGIERNSEGFITSIKVKLEDEEKNQKISANWDTSRNPNGIPDISIGRIKGKLKLSSN
jgi:RPA family protein